MNEINHIKTNYPEYQKLYEEATQFYNQQLISLTEIGGKDIIEAQYKQILLQFCIIATQGLKSIYNLLEMRQFFTPLIILRSMFEYFITFAYIDKDKEERTNQYILQGIKIRRRNLGVVKEKHPDSFDEKMRKRLEELNIEYKKHSEEIEKWENIEQRADDLDMLETYTFEYRYLCTYTHPDSLSIEDFFEYKDKRFVVYDYKEDPTKRTLELVLGMTNILMSHLNEQFKLSDGKKYEELNNKIMKLQIQRKVQRF